ncbi:NADH-quinone oxidoreductase subunit L [Paludibacterium denitrificans]|uniref:NADH-quinone oxidoreductase subunit L n=1 Tax=Paludibacterium denitrificans TaxID=2675226 RepID=UPI002477FA46|nr:NADH-quinone oxidoreductase subunit L [Paludibacterium denitrificans]
MFFLPAHALIALLWLLPALGTPSLARHWWMAMASAAAGAVVALGLMAVEGIQPALLFQLLIQLLVWVILRFSVRYLNGEGGQARFLKAVGWLLFGSTLVVASGDWATLLLGWAVTSRALHSLLTFYPARPQACIAARREAVASRLAELCLLLGALAIIWSVGSLRFAEAGVALAEPVQQAGRVVGAVLVVVSVLIKTAQLPFHGWVTQVMEAPTPVSALLHAGVVNLGGMVLIKLAELWTAAPAASWLLTIWGGVTAALSCWVMLTRISIKLRSAWSTCAQMGFMLMECGTGQYSLALLHLIAHSLYKAHAFLTSGSQVRVTIRQPVAALPHDGWRYLASGVIGLGAAGRQSATVVLGFGASGASAHAAGGGDRAGLGAIVFALARRCAGFAAVSGLSATAYPVCSHPAGWRFSVPLSCQLLVVVFFAALYLMQAWLVRHPDSPLSQRLYAMAFGGLYLDEWWVRLTTSGRVPQNPRFGVPGMMKGVAHEKA